MARERRPAGRASGSASRTSPSASGYAAARRRPPPTPTAPRGIPLAVPETGPVSRPLDLTATLRVRDGSGRPVERSLTRPLLPAAPLIGLRPLFERRGGRGRHRRLRGDRRSAPTSRPPTSRRVDWTLSRIETDFQWYEVDGTWNYQPITRRSRVANGTLDLTAAAPARLDLPVEWGRYELALAATDGRYIATSVGFDAGWGAAGAGSETPDFLELSLDRAAYAAGDTARAAHRRAEPRPAPRRGHGRPADRDPHPRASRPARPSSTSPSPRTGAPAPMSPRR